MCTASQNLRPSLFYACFDCIPSLKNLFSFDFNTFMINDVKIVFSLYMRDTQALQSVGRYNLSRNTNDFRSKKNEMIEYLVFYVVCLVP